MDPDRTLDNPAEQGDLRARIIAATAALIASGGRDAATTRAVATAAGVQAPTIYRLFGDKRGLLDAVARYALNAYIAEKGLREPHPDPVQELRDGWDMHVQFGLAHPGPFAIMAGDPDPRPPAPAFAKGIQILQRRMRNIALAGRLRTSEARAIALLHAMGTGTILTLLAQPEEQRDPGLSAAAREAVISAITGEPISRADMGTRGVAATLRARLDDISVLTPGERLLLEELLDRITADT